MAKIIWILVLFVGLPAGIYFLLDDALSTQEHEWFREVLKDLPQNAQQQFTLSAICYNPQLVPKADLSEACTPYKNTRHLRVVAVGAALAPILYALLLLVLSSRARKDRTLLLLIFRPGVYISSILVASLLVLQSLLVIGVMYGNSFGHLTEDNYVWVVILGVVALVGAFFTMRPLIFGLPHAKTSVLGIALQETEHVEIWSFIRELAKKAEAPAPNHLVVGFTPNFFVTEAEVECASGTLQGATMYLSLPLCRILSMDEFSAVVLHELAHFKGEDAKFSIHFYPIYRGVSDSATGVANASSQIMKVGSHIPIAAFKILFLLAGLFLLPSVYLLSFFLDSFSRAENHIGRERELAADSLAARIQGAEPMAAVLIKMTAFTSVWWETLQWAKASSSTGKVTLGENTYDARQFFLNMSQVFSAVAQDSASPERLENLDLVTTPHPTDTHPPLSVRLASLQTSLAVLGPIALHVDLEESSSSLINNVESIEITLSDMQMRQLAG